jgi:hypothetical protein
MRTILFSSLIVLGAIGACDRNRDDKVVVETQKTIEGDDGTVRQETEVKTIDLESERTSLSRSVEERTMRLDARIDELERRGDEKSKEIAAMLRAKRDQARAKLTELGTRTEENWQGFKRDVSDAWDQLERDVNEATR